MSHNSMLGLSRRQFVKVATITAATLVGGRPLLARALRQEASDKPLYCFPVLGDVHYDLMSHHDMDWVRKEKPGDERQINNYVKVTETLTPQLLTGVSGAVKAAPAAVPFVIQVGDLVEGLCGSYDLQVLQFRDTFAAIEKAAFGVPFLITKGNHDITGPGANEAYDKELIPWLAAQGKQETFAGASYFRKQDEDLFVFFDGYKPDLDWLEETLKANKARHIFFVVHQPVVPYNARANWGVLGHERQAEQRVRLIGLLGQYNAIVLGGHLHKYCALTRKAGDGLITQLAVSSVLRNENEKSPKEPLSGIEKYTPALVELEPKFSPDTVDLRRQILTAEAPSITSYEYSDIPGYAMMKVFADRVEADIFISLSQEKWKTDALGKKEAAPAM